MHTSLSKEGRVRMIGAGPADLGRLVLHKSARGNAGR